jgi:hypothetical protein
MMSGLKPPWYVTHHDHELHAWDDKVDVTIGPLAKKLAIPIC